MESENAAVPVDLASARYVGFWKRLVASIVDSLILIVIIVPLALAVYGTDYVRLSAQGRTTGFDILVQGVLPALAVILFWRLRGATPGKMLYGARIVDAETGAPPSTRRLVVRYVAYIVSTLPLGLGFLWIAFDRRKQGWHDKLARTVVIIDSKKS